MTPTPATEIRQSDADLVAATRAGDRGAFSELVRRYERAARGICLAVLHDEHLASDAAQDAFVAAYRRIGKLRDAALFGSWLLAICRNESVNTAKKIRRHSQVSQETAAAEPDAKDHSDLLAAVAELPEQERTVVMLKFFGDHDVADIAVMLARPLGTVTKQLSRAYERLRKALP
jgi:RNA polymerase sigma-70 factor (ECF subfamily)